MIRGNHDKVVAGIENLESFNEVAQAAALWTMDHIEPADHDYLLNLPKGPIKTEHFQMWHGSVADEDEYVTFVREASLHFAEMELPLGFFGHTHRQGGFFSKRGRTGSLLAVEFNQTERTIELLPDFQYMVNPGSVGSRAMATRALLTPFTIQIKNYLPTGAPNIRLRKRSGRSKKLACRKC